jgi:hypothetical protein
MKFKLPVACAFASVLLFLIALTAYVVFYNLNWSYSRSVKNQNIIVDAYLKYHDDKGAFPSSLEDLVHSRYLPEYGDFYLEPNRLISSKVYFLESSYKVFPMMSDNSNCLKIIGERRPMAGQSNYVFLPETNARIRDAIR